MPAAADFTEELSALVASRICHDLVNPLGAVGNGLELLSMTQAASGPELALVADSLKQATARLRFMRVAFGRAGAGAMLGTAEARSILEDAFGGGRFRVTWEVAQDRPRAEVRLAFLLLLCLEAALPRGGAVTLRHDGAGWGAQVASDDLRIDPMLWGPLETAAPGSAGPDVAEAAVQFALAHRALAASGRPLTRRQDGAGMTLAW